MGRTLKTDISGPDWRRALEALERDGPHVLFAPDLPHGAPLVLEIGFGRGEFLTELAGERPEAACLGVEYSHKRVTKLARRLARGELRNVRLLCARGEDVVAVLPPACVDEVWINFPDPWPKKRHARRRLVQPAFAAALVERLAPGALVHLATDHVAYAEQMHEVLSGQTGLENRNAPAPWLPDVRGRRATAYELEWRAEGRPLHFFAYRRPA